MSQFYPHVRTLFRGAVEDQFIEAATIYLYHTMACEVFGRRFADRALSRTRSCLKHTTPDEALVRVTQIASTVAALDQAPDPLLAEGAVETTYEHHLRSVIRALLLAAGQGTDDPEIVKSTFVPLERVLERLRTHLRGIKRQNYMLLR